MNVKRRATRKGLRILMGRRRRRTTTYRQLRLDDWEGERERKSYSFGCLSRADPSEEEGARMGVNSQRARWMCALHKWPLVGIGIGIGEEELI